MGPILGGNQYKSMVIFRDFPYNSALFGLVYNDPCIANTVFGTTVWFARRTYRFDGMACLFRDI